MLTRTRKHGRIDWMVGCQGTSLVSTAVRRATACPVEAVGTVVLHVASPPSNGCTHGNTDCTEVCGKLGIATLRCRQARTENCCPDGDRSRRSASHAGDQLCRSRQPPFSTFVFEVRSIGGRRRCRCADDHSQFGAWPRRCRRSQRASRRRRHRHRKPRHLRPRLLSGAAGRAVRGGLRRQGKTPRGGQEDRRRANTATRTAQPIATFANCWTAAISTRC